MRLEFVLIGFVLVASFGFADDNLDESKAIEKIKLLGGKVTRDDRLPDPSVIGISFLN